eukprot:3983966-Pleurochrysis_carterae.AAC.3
MSGQVIMASYRMLTTCLRYGLPCLIAMSDSVLAMPSLLKMLTRWALSRRVRQEAIDLLNTRVLAGKRAMRVVCDWTTCRSEGGDRPRAPLRRVRACVGRSVGERRRVDPE